MFGGIKVVGVAGMVMGVDNIGISCRTIGESIRLRANQRAGQANPTFGIMGVAVFGQVYLVEMKLYRTGLRIDQE